MLRIGALRGSGRKRASRKLASLKHPAVRFRFQPPLLGATPKGPEYRKARARSLKVAMVVRRLSEA